MLQTFVSKPSTCKAYQFTGNGLEPEVMYGKDPEGRVSGDKLPFVETINGNKARVYPGDWIVQEPDGIHYYPVKNDIFIKRWMDARDADLEQPPASFLEKLKKLINLVSRENNSNTPDHILATFMVDCLKAFEKANNDREKWYGKALTVQGVKEFIGETNELYKKTHFSVLPGEGDRCNNCGKLLSKHIGPTKECPPKYD